MSKRKFRLAVLPGEGIGPEVISVSIDILSVLSKLYDFDVEYFYAPIGEEAVSQFNEPLPAKTIEVCESCDAVLFGAVNRYGILEIRKHFDLFANIRPVRAFPLHQKKIDLVIIRELCSGLYFGPSGRSTDHSGEYGYHTMKYYDHEIERIAKVALYYASSRSCRLTVAHKENALPHIPWMSIVEKEALNFPEVKVTSMYVDNAAYQMVLNPCGFDVILADNLMGDILSDLGGALVGSLGMLGSSSVNSSGFGLYEPVHGTAPDLTGKDLANPTGSLLSVSMMLDDWKLKEASLALTKGINNLFTAQEMNADMFSCKKKGIIKTTEFKQLLIEEITKTQGK